MCRMSSKDKMNVQDQSKERGVSGGLELSEEKENSPGKAAALLTLTESSTQAKRPCDCVDSKNFCFSFTRKLHRFQSRH